jgi:vancomycin permeability regulator SanA
MDNPKPINSPKSREILNEALNKPQKKRSWIKYTLGLIIIFGISTLTIISSYIRLNYNHTFIEQKDCAVVFGAAVWKDDIPSHALFDRTISAINLYKNKHVNCLIFSGGKSKYGTHESDVMKVVAKKNNIPEEDIFLDYNGVNTLETLRNIKQNFAGKSFVLVSNDFHLARIKLIANKLKIKNFALHAAKYNQGKYFKNYNFFWREVAGVLYYSVFLW